jgi:C4-type Zn-finger protein
LSHRDRFTADEKGTTRLLLTTIPYFKEIIVMSFRCDHCGHRDSEINSAGEIQRTLPLDTIWQELTL